MKILFILIFLFLPFKEVYSKEKCLKYGVIPYTNISDIQASYKEWKTYLESKINRCIDISFESNYGDLIQKFAKKEVDFGFIGPFSYVLTKELADVEPIVTGITSDGFATYRSLMMATSEVSQSLGIKQTLEGEDGMIVIKRKLEKYKNKWMVAFTDESSTSGYAVPNYYMKKVFLDPGKYFKKLNFVGTHDAAQLVVAYNIIPISFGAEMFYINLLEKKKINKKSNIIIWKSDKIPKSPIIVNSTLSKKLKLQLQNALISMPKQYIPKLAKEIGYIKATKKDYEIIEKMNRYLKKI